jgi:lipoprotein-anchoring transpeptidase ErfK/SrfK
MSRAQITGAALALLLLLAGCSPPQTRSHLIEATIARALAVEGEAVDQDDRAALRATVARARLLEARELGSRWRFWERPQGATSAWHEAARLAWLHTRATRDREGALAGIWEAERARAGRSLEEAREIATRLGGASVAAALESLEGTVLRADGWAARGQLARAVSILRADGTERSLRRAAAAIDQHFDDPGLRSLWSGWVARTLATSESASVAVVVVDKQRQRLEVYESGDPIASYPAEFGSGGIGRKLHAGDKETPEGLYRVTEVRRPGMTKYHRALMLDYPNTDDWERFRRARAQGEVPRGATIGGLIEIHGHGGKGNNWTDGCVALTNEHMDELVKLVGVGTPVAIVGTVP